MPTADDVPIQVDEDVRLMLKVKTGDRQAYAWLYEKYVPILRRYLVGREGQSQSWEDLAQEVFARIWRRRSQYQPLAPARSYILGVAANVLRESQTKARSRAGENVRDPESIADTKRPSPPSQAHAAEQLRAVRALMASLPARQRQVAEMVYLAGLAPDEVARRLGCSVKAVRVHLSLARRKLRILARLCQ